MSRTPFLVIALATTLLLASCSGSTSSSSNTSPLSNGVPMILTIGDTPPNGVAVLFLEALITKATLQSSDPSKPAVTVLSTPVEVEFGHLQTDRAFLNLANVTPDTYKSITLSFGNATLTIENHSGAVFGSCANNSACELTPTFNPSTVTVSSAPFPITITQNSVVGLRLDFNVNSSVEPDLSINPTVTLKSFVHKDESERDKEMEDVDEIDGQVTSVGNNQFTLMNEQGGQSFNISVNSSTVFEDFGRTACTANPPSLSCVSMGQILDVDLSANGMGAMLAKRVEFEENANHQAIKGIITSVDSSTQFHMVVFSEEPTIVGISEGSPVVVMIQPTAVFQVGSEELGEDNSFSSTGLSFTSGANLLVGQDVQIRPGTASTSEGVTSITTDLVRLWPSQITGSVGSVDTSTGKFSLTGLSPLFTGATPPVTTISVETLSNVLLMDGDSSQSALPAVGSSVSVKGLLFDTSGTPTLVTRTMRKQHDD
jgi:hypothetical protein